MARNADRFLDWLLELAEARGGKPFKLRLLGRSDLLVTAVPEHHEHIFKTQFDNFIKGDQFYELLVDVAGPNVVIIDGERWKYQRKVLAKLFTARVLREHMMPIVAKHTRVLLNIFEQAAEKQTPLELCELMHGFTLDSFAEIGFGSELRTLKSGHDHPFGRALDDALHIAAARRMVPRWLWKAKRWLNVGSERQLRESVRVMDSLIMGIILEAIAKSKQRGYEVEEQEKRNSGHDIVSIILDRMKADGNDVEPSEIRSLALLSLIAGRDTTANAMCWILHMLHEHPRVEQKLRAELLEKLPKLALEEDYLPSLDDLQDLPYVDAVINETLRLLPIFPFTTRQCVRDTVFPDGTFVRAGTILGLPRYVLARLKMYWGEDAADFVPERFLDATSGKLVDLPAASTNAFGAGPRICVGRRLATMEMKLLVSCIVARYHLAELPGQTVRYKLAMSLSMKDPLMVNVEHVNRKVGESA
ncbi:Cytochrome p450 [Phytophthora cinnamomi]|uniref:Cytochrome p450 n=1 Tax=Phytophthora cinnamomi TaxID=4785 RepID=UPI003559A479|nr:Cytochrome p450 [Phytophthora cinnamomi]